MEQRQSCDQQRDFCNCLLVACRIYALALRRGHTWGHRFNPRVMFVLVVGSWVLSVGKEVYATVAAQPAVQWIEACRTAIWIAPSWGPSKYSSADRLFVDVADALRGTHRGTLTVMRSQV